MATALQSLSRDHFSAPPVIETAETIGAVKSTKLQTSIPAQESRDISLQAKVVGTLSEAYSRERTKITATLDRWSSALEHRFARLAARIAAGTASAEQKKQFAKLQDDRRRTLLARSGQEVLRDFEERQRTFDLIQALKRYVEFAPH